LKQTTARKDLEKGEHIPRDFDRRGFGMTLSQMLSNFVDRPFSRAKTRNLRRGPAQVKTRFRVQEQVATGSPIETKAHFGTKLRSGYVAVHAVGHVQLSFILILFDIGHIQAIEQVP
jgi:hypothetical protein